MSGGSYDYIYYKIDDFAVSLRGTHVDPRRMAFSKLLKLTAKAAHDIEWVDSCDYGSGDEHAAIDDVFSFLSENPDVIIKAKAYDNLSDLIRNFLLHQEK